MHSSRPGGRRADVRLEGPRGAPGCRRLRWVRGERFTLTPSLSFLVSGAGLRRAVLRVMAPTDNQHL